MEDIFLNFLQLDYCLLKSVNTIYLFFTGMENKHISRVTYPLNLEKGIWSLESFKKISKDLGETEIYMK